MIKNAIIFMMICLFSFIPLLLGEYARNRSVSSTEDFILEGRRMKILPMYATVFATWMSVFAFVGGITYFYEQGPVYMSTVGWDALFAVLFASVGRRIWFYGKKHNYITPTDFFNDIYDSKTLNLIVTVIVIICTMLYLQAQVTGSIIVMEAATGGKVRWYISGLIFFAILVIYLWAGGLRAIAMTDSFYGILTVIAILSAGFFVMHMAGGREFAFTELIDRDPANVSLSGELSGERTMMWIALFLVVPVGAFMGPQIWIRNYASATERNFNILPFLLYISSIIWLGTLMAGSAGMVIARDAIYSESALVQILQEYADPFFTTFIIIGIYAAIFSTANSQIHALSAVLTIDVYRRYINSKAPDKRQVFIAKWTVLLISVASYLCILLVPHNIFDLAVMAMGGTAQLIIPVLGALFWKRSTARAAIIGLVLGEAAFLITTLTGLTEVSVCALLGLTVNLLSFTTAALLEKPRVTVYRKIEEYRREYRQRQS